MRLFSSTLVLGALFGGAHGQTIAKIEMAKDNGKGNPGGVVKGFGPKDNPIHCIVHLKPLATKTVFTGTLVATKAAKVKDFKVASTDLPAPVKLTNLDFKFSLPRPWPVGSYKVEIRANGKLLRDLAFEIK